MDRVVLNRAKERILIIEPGIPATGSRNEENLTGVSPMAN